VQPPPHLYELVVNLLHQLIQPGILPVQVHLGAGVAWGGVGWGGVAWRGAAFVTMAGRWRPNGLRRCAPRCQESSPCCVGRSSSAQAAQVAPTSM
jgi:hypothetical protein